ncbi:DUF4239 domain-containing protein [Lentzea tibetensis]|uniref:DUF4239 domain-containing protein n=1 Tax=Lentzea tibetensis TaxID=2591470 RepID=A0A563F0E0_9PSEU|nr:DUF4239 domain-containing protein [Lentzea tibetensis]TWP53430.1 DUF4239 domain-containing protein [Lentzea tibetensis]
MPTRKSGPSPTAPGHSWRTRTWYAEVALGLTAIALLWRYWAELPTWLAGALIVIAMATLADSALPVGALLLPPRIANRYAGLLAAAFGTVGTVYAVVAGFAVSSVWDTLQETQRVISHEANALADLERMSKGFPVEVRRQVVEAERTYGRLVVGEEWQLMARNKSSTRANAAFVEVWSVYTDMGPELRASPLYDKSMDRLNELGNARRQRLLAAGEEVPSLMWVLLVIGSMAMLLLSYCFGVWKSWQIRLIVLSMSAMIAFTMFLVAALEGPFDGKVSLQPDAITLVLSGMQQLEQ